MIGAGFGKTPTANHSVRALKATVGNDYRCSCVMFFTRIVSCRTLNGRYWLMLFQWYVIYWSLPEYQRKHCRWLVAGWTSLLFGNSLTCTND